MMKKIIKISISALIFYLILILLITLINCRNISKEESASMLSKQGYILRNAGKLTESQFLWNIKDEFCDISFSGGENFYLSGLLCDENMNINLKTGEYISFRYDDSPIEISLGKYLSDEQRDILYKEFYDKKYEGLSKVDVMGEVTVYFSESGIIPVKIILSYSRGHTNSSAVQLDFDVDPLPGYIIRTFKLDPPNGELSLQNIYSRKNTKRLNECEEFALESIKYNHNSGYFDWFYLEHTFFEKFYFEDRTYYMAVAMRAFILEDAVNDLILTYIIIFIAIVILTLLIIRKYTNSYEKQQEFEQSSKELTNAIAHELKTPLGIIHNYAETLKENINEEKKDLYLDVIMDETRRMDSMLIQMLNFSRSEEYLYKVNFEKCSLINIVNDMVRRYQKLIDDKNISLAMEVNENCMILADKRMLEQVISNLVTNAIKYTDNNEKIIINIKSEWGLTTFEIINTGASIPKDRIKKIWDAFFKTDESRTRFDGEMGEGTGLGLAIVKRNYEFHGWRYGVENIESGVRFWFSAQTI